MKRLLTLFFISFICRLSMLCVPAYPYKVQIPSEKGDSVEIFIKGDEHNKFAISMDGYLLAPRKEGWYYLTNDPTSGVKVSDISLGSLLSDSQIKTLVNSGSNPLSSPNKSIIRKSPRLSISSGISNALIILIEFPDLTFIKNKQEMTDLFNKVGYDDDGAKGSVRDFYRYASYGSVDLISNVYGPFVSLHPMNFYGGNNIYGNDSNVPQLVVEAIENLPDDIDLSMYDNDNDGIVDNVHIIFAGHGEEAGASSSAIWSHEYPHTLPVTKNGYRFAGYSCTPELRSNFGQGISRIGVICHELGHAFGVNDFYDVDYSSNGSYDGTGVWDLMASGSWNNYGISPANFNPYVKIIDLGWINPVTPDKSNPVSIDAYNEHPTVMKIPTSYPGDYYLLEYRARRQFDEGLPGEGLMIYHVHPNIESRRSSNTINNTHPQCLYPVCASNVVSPVSTSDYGNINSPECPFPGSTSNTSFLQASQWYGGEQPFSIRNIRLADSQAFFDIYLDENEPSEPDNPNSDSLTFREDFENGLNRFFPESIEGTTIWEVYPTNSLSMFSNLPAPYEGKRALMLYGGVKTERLYTSYLTSDPISLNTDSIHTLSFWIKTLNNPSSGHHSLCVSIQNMNSPDWDNVYESSDMIEDWSEIKIPLPAELSYLRLRFSGTIMNRGIFIDDVRITSNSSARIMETYDRSNNISFTYKPLCITSYDYNHVMIHDIYGKLILNAYLSPSETLMPNMAQGVYIICTDNGERHKVVIP